MASCEAKGRIMVSQEMGAGNTDNGTTATFEMRCRRVSGDCPLRSQFGIHGLIVDTFKGHGVTQQYDQALAKWQEIVATCEKVLQPK